MTKVKVRKVDELGNVINVSKNPEFGFITVEQDAVEFNNGWLRTANRTALIHGSMKDLKSCNYTEGFEIPGKIIVKESLTPFNVENPDSDLKIAGNSGIVCRVDDQPIYRKTFFTTNLNDEDCFIQHTNSEEIKQLLAAQRAIVSIKELSL